jgi:hypothetical protein
LPDETISWLSTIKDGLRSQAKRASDFPEGILMSAGILYCASGVKVIFEDVIQELDKLLYKAEARGRNRFVNKEISEYTYYPLDPSRTGKGLPVSREQSPCSRPGQQSQQINP